MIYKNGEGFAPSMVHKPLEDSVQAVKPGKAPYLRHGRALKGLEKGSEPGEQLPESEIRSVTLFRSSVPPGAPKVIALGSFIGVKSCVPMNASRGVFWPKSR